MFNEAATTSAICSGSSGNICRALSPSSCQAPASFERASTPGFLLPCEAMYSLAVRLSPSRTGLTNIVAASRYNNDSCSDEKEVSIQLSGLHSLVAHLSFKWVARSLHSAQ